MVSPGVTAMPSREKGRWCGWMEEIGDDVGAGTGSEVDGVEVEVEVGVDAGIGCGDGSEGVRSAGLGAEAGSSAKPKKSEPWSERVVGAAVGATDGEDAYRDSAGCGPSPNHRSGMHHQQMTVRSAPAPQAPGPWSAYCHPQGLAHPP